MSQIIFMCFSFSVINSLYLDILAIIIKSEKASEQWDSKPGGHKPWNGPLSMGPCI